MANSTGTKLKIKAGDQLLVLNAPTDFEKDLGELPTGSSIISSGKNYHQVHWFVLNKAEMEKDLSRVLKLLKDDVIVWIYYPKQSSKIQTDLTRDKGWDSLLTKDDKLTWISLISFNSTWSVFGFRLKTKKDKNKEASTQTREIFNWVDPSTKTVRLPIELINAFKKHKSAEEKFNILSFSNKKEYIEWIVTAKREQTKQERIAGTIERLNNGWKNPRNI